MLTWTFVFLAFAVIAGIMGFRPGSSTSIYLAKLFFYFCTVIFFGLVITLILHSGPAPEHAPMLAA